MAVNYCPDELERCSLTDNFDSSSSEESDVTAPPRVGGKLARVGVAVGFSMALFGTFLLSTESTETRQPTQASTQVIGLSKMGAKLASDVMQIANAEIVKDGKAAAKPMENLQDGNLCNHDEEEYAGLCYAKCSELTQNSHSFRKSAWSCCKEENCNPLLSLFTCCTTRPGMCGGFSVSGASDGASCPHALGGCLEDEEAYYGMCYMKCSLLTGNLFPHRNGAASCCKTTGLRCMSQVGADDGLPGMTLTNATLAVGGGCGNKRSNGTYCKPHPPSQSITESEKSIEASEKSAESAAQKSLLSE